MGTDPGVWYPIAMVVMTCSGGIVQESAGMPIRLLSILYNIIALKLIQWF